MKSELQLKRIIRCWVIFFVVSLVISGITAFALETELAWLDHFLSAEPSLLQSWIHKVYSALRDTNQKYPFLAYGYDWLAFAHLVIAVSFYGVWKDPVRNQWIIEFGMIACAMIFPLALIGGTVRGIPFYWQMIDCSFGVIGMIPLTICFRNIKQLERLQNEGNFYFTQ